MTLKGLVLLTLFGNAFNKQKCDFSFFNGQFFDIIYVQLLTQSSNARSPNQSRVSGKGFL